MAPSRKSKSVNKRFSYIDEVASNKDAQNTNKIGHRKRKLSDLLGSQWSKEELGNFYEAYRKYGKDWKKVAAAVRNRSVEMVEALYTMNRAYLSLPEGTASLVGLIAMMTDHYSVLGGSDSEQESNEGTGPSRKHQKLGRGKIRTNISKGSDGQLPNVLQSQTAASNYGCLSLLKKRRSGTKPRAVGKRTPRVPISLTYDKDNGEKYLLPTRQGLKPDSNDVDDDDVAHEIAVALTEASQRGDSPQLSRTPKRKTEGTTQPPARNGKRHGESDLSSTKLPGGEMVEGCCELSLGSTEADNGYYARDRSHLMGAGRAGIREVHQKGKRYHGKKPEVEESVENQFDDIKEACSGTEEEGQTLVAVKGKVDPEIADSKILSSSKGPKKKSRKVMFGGDEGFAFNPLEALADLSLMMPATNFDTESSVKIKEDNSDIASKSKQRGHHSTAGVDVTTFRAPKLGRALTLDVSSIAEEKEGTPQSNAGIRKRKQKCVPCKIPKNDVLADSQLSEFHKIEVTDEVKNFVTKGKRSHSAARLKQGKLGRTPERTDHEREEKDVALSTVQISSENHFNLLAKGRSRRKMEIQKPEIQADLKSSENIVNDQIKISVSSFFDREGNLKKKLANLLSWYQARRWCAFEWFYGSIDYPWFAKREFVEYLDHVGLGHVPRLTRVEWGVIRSSLGRPRRFSEQFLKEEKEKLNQYRESVRKHYTELRAGTREGLPTDLAQPLSVGQHVIAIHPRTREIHDGNVLTVDHSRCRVQFDRPELGVEFVMCVNVPSYMKKKQYNLSSQDFDCMPSNPLENMPASLARHFLSINKAPENCNELKINGLSKEGTKGGMKFTSRENPENIDGRSRTFPSAYTISNSMQPKGHSSSISSQVKVGCSEPADAPQAATSQLSVLTQIQAKEADVQALSTLTRALDKKEAVVSELRRMNDQVLENQKDGGDDTLKDSEPFKKKYAEVLFQLNEINEQVSSALFCLRQRNTYQGNSTVMWVKPMDSAGDSGGQSSSFDHSACHSQESGPHVAEIVESSRTKARTMVNSAMQAMTSLKERGNDIEAIEDAIDFVNNRLLVDDLGTTSIRSSSASDPAHVTLAQDQLASCTSNPSATSHAPMSKLENVSEQNESQIPSELIAHCVATLLMIQMCTERQFPPADVAQVLDSAVTSLQPCCSQNLPVYAEIQKCMGIIRNQILALIPT